MSAVVSARKIAAARSFLFVPGTRPDRFERALASGADEIVLDLEDAVAPDAKATAREEVGRWLAEKGTGIVRVNSSGSGWYGEDIAMLASRPCAVMLPKVSGHVEVTALLDQLAPGSCVIPLLESALGVLEAPATCAVKGVVRVAFGNGDFARDLGVDHADRLALEHARSAIVLASAAGRLPAPIDGVTAALNDEGALRSDACHAAALGFAAKLCIHPKQVPVVHEAFNPSLADLAWARAVVAASDEPVAVVEGQFVDRPLVDSARRILDRASAHAYSVQPGLRHSLGDREDGGPDGG